MYIREVSKTIPHPTNQAAKALISARAPNGFVTPEWLVNLVVIAYQNGRYDEASSETFDASL